MLGTRWCVKGSLILTYLFFLLFIFCFLSASLALLLPLTSDYLQTESHTSSPMHSTLCVCFAPALAEPRTCNQESLRIKGPSVVTESVGGKRLV